MHFETSHMRCLCWVEELNWFWDMGLNLKVKDWIGLWKILVIIQATLLAHFLLNFTHTCMLWMIRGEPQLILGYRIKGQVYIWEKNCLYNLVDSIQTTVLLIHFKASHISWWWWEEEPYWFQIIGYTLYCMSRFSICYYSNRILKISVSNWMFWENNHDFLFPAICDNLRIIQPTGGISQKTGDIIQVVCDCGYPNVTFSFDYIKVCYRISSWTLLQTMRGICSCSCRSVGRKVDQWVFRPPLTFRNGYLKTVLPRSFRHGK